jgi:hypothetical protein
MPDSDPEINRRPFASAAFDYVHSGLGMPVPLNGKIIIPSGVTGGEGTITAEQVERWVERYGSSNIGVVLDTTVVAIDVDHGYRGHDGREKHGADTLRAFEATLGALPPTITSTSRHGLHPESRIRFYRVTAAEGASLRGNIDLRIDGQGPGDVEVIHHHYRYTVVWPSTHPDTAEAYRWYTADGLAMERVPSADELPDLPSRWVSHLLTRTEAKAAANYGVATPSEVAGLLTDGEPDPALAALAVRFWTEQIGHGTGREDESDLLGMTKVLARLIVVGRLTGSRKAVEIARRGYLREPYGTEVYARAFDAALAGSLRFWSKYEEENAILRGALFPEADDAAKGDPARPVAASVSDDSWRPADGTGHYGEPDDAVNGPAAAIDSPVSHTAGPTDAPVAESTVPHEETEAEALLRKRIDEERIRLRVRREAERLEALEINAEVEIADGIPLDEFLAQPDDDPEYRIDGLLPTGGNILLAAQYKAGKSTAVLNLIRSFADGDEFLGRFITDTARVAVIDDEMDPRAWRHRLREQGVQNPKNVALFPLRGKVSTFDVVDPVTRARWAAKIAATHADVLIFDCLRPALDALGLDESREAGVFLVALDALKHEAGVQEMIVVHHMGHDATRSRGDSRLLDWPDANWRIMRQETPNDDPRAPREFEAYGREVDVDRAMLLHDDTTHHLTLSDRRAPDANRDALQSLILELITANPGISQRAILAKTVSEEGHAKTAVLGMLKSMETGGRIYVTPAANRGYAYFLLTLNE